jgi:phosphate-selective porin OprO/OprP
VFALGLNWYLNPNIKVLFNYLMIDVERLNPAGPGNATPFGAGASTPPVGVDIGQDLDVYAVRTQFSF